MTTMKRILKKMEKASSANIAFKNVDGLMSVTAHEQATTEPPVMARTMSVAHFANHSELRKPATGAIRSSDAAIVRTISGIMKMASFQVISMPRASSNGRAPHPPFGHLLPARVVQE